MLILYIAKGMLQTFDPKKQYISLLKTEKNVLCEFERLLNLRMLQDLEIAL